MERVCAGSIHWVLANHPVHPHDVACASGIIIKPTNAHIATLFKCPYERSLSDYSCGSLFPRWDAALMQWGCY
jgi:hypothetical protein